jgi:hypothetical protein
MSALLVYRNSTPEALAWAEDYKARAKEVLDARLEWMKAIYDAAGVPDPEPYDKNVRSAWIRSGGAFIGLSWPRSMDSQLPEGWFRPAKEQHLVRPRADKRGKKIIAEMRRYDRPDARRELAEKFGMPDHLFAGNGLYTNGVAMKDDGVWVTWGSKDVEDELADPKVMRHYPRFADAGWVRVPLVEYIERFGEDAL